MTGLPDSGAEWPPSPYNQVLDACALRQVWWEGDPGKLAGYYGGGYGNTLQPLEGVGSRLKAGWDAFWGRYQSALSSEPKHIHAPVAATIARIAASILFSQSVTFRDPNAEGDQTELQEKIDLILNTDDMYSRLLTAAESAAVFGGTFGRVVWNKKVRDHTWIDFVDTDRALPTFQMGVLTEVSFWTELTPLNDQVVARHIEHHSPGLIEHALFFGDRTSIGRRVSLSQHPELTNFESIVATGTEKLTAEYFPNHRPNPAWRHEPALRHLGRSDLSDDVIHILDKIDETWSSLNRDLELGKGRMFVSEELLTVHGPGKGTSFDKDRAIFSPINTGTSAQGEAETYIHGQQFDIRVTEHREMLDALLRLAISRAGYSPLTFGLQDEVAVTATETDAKERDTNATRAAKIRLWTPALAQLATAQLEVESEIFGGPKPDELIEVDFPPSHQESDREVAETLDLYARSESMSIETRVRRANPEQDDAWVKEEVGRIRDDRGPSEIALPDDGLPDDEPAVDPFAVQSSEDEPTPDEQAPEGIPPQLTRR